MQYTAYYTLESYFCQDGNRHQPGRVQRHLTICGEPILGTETGQIPECLGFPPALEMLIHQAVRRTSAWIQLEKVWYTDAPRRWNWLPTTSLKRH